MLTCPEDIHIYTAAQNARVVWPDPVATDNVGLLGVPKTDTSIPAVLDIGRHPVTYTVRDKSGNPGRCTMHVTITNTGECLPINWNGNVVMSMTFSSLAALKAVCLTTFGSNWWPFCFSVRNDNFQCSIYVNFVKMITLSFKCIVKRQFPCIHRWNFVKMITFPFQCIIDSRYFAVKHASSKGITSVRQAEGSKYDTNVRIQAKNFLDVLPRNVAPAVSKQ